MNNFFRLEIITRDRLGITVEILEKIYKRKINLISMEVFYEKVCLKMGNMDELTKKILIDELYDIQDVISIHETELLYYEQNERRLLAVIDSVDEGIMAIDKKFNISIFNSYCEELFNYKKEEVMGTDIRGLIGEESYIQTLIKKGIEYDNIELNIRNDRGNIHYLSTGRAIKDDNDKTIGAVASIKDVNKARQLVNIISTKEEGAFKDIIGNSAHIEKVKKITATVAKSDSTVLLRGDSGTGKELFSKAIHNLSNRRHKSFVTISCAALPESLLESELFGYEKGSFTGAILSGKDGLFVEANGGTLFLDEIGELPIILQAKLLRVLQEGKIRKIGSNKEINVDVRVIAATNKNLEEMIKNKEFREDLYYRLNVIPIYIPKLKDRIEDIPILVQFFIDKLNIKLKRNVRGAQLEFINKLMEYDWPGNVRELQNVIERTMNLCEGDVLTSKELIFDFNNRCSNEVNVFSDFEDFKQEELKELMEEFEKEVLTKAISNYSSYRKAAKALGVSHTTIINKIKKYNIEV